METTPSAATIEKAEYQNSTYEIVSKVAYLIGVPQRIFENEHEPPQRKVFLQLELDKNARIVRNLCVARTAIERNFKSINQAMREGLFSLYSLPNAVPPQCLRQLEEDGVRFIRGSAQRLSQHVVEINRLLSDRVNNVKGLFPLWLNWDYVKDLFLMPDGLTEEGTKEAATRYYAHMDYYPYQMYINWYPADEGNILYNDKKFVSLLYHWNGDRFTDFSKVSDVSGRVKGTIYDFLDQGERIMVLVDCENSDPFKLSSALRGLDQESLGKILGIVLFDDVHTTSAWGILEQFTSLPVEHVLVQRLKQDKSQVDLQLVSRAFKETYERQVDSFILVSSDSDYWALISNMEGKARFLVMVEREKCGPDLKRALAESGIFYCYIDDFYSGDAESLRTSALFQELHQYLDRNMRVNIYQMLEQALWNTHITMTDSEKKQFLQKHLRNMALSIDGDGNVTLDLKR